MEPTTTVTGEETGSAHLIGDPLRIHWNVLTSLKLTASLPLKMDGWNRYYFPIGFWPIFRGELLVSGGVWV